MELNYCRALRQLRYKGNSEARLKFAISEKKFFFLSSQKTIKQNWKLNVYEKNYLIFIGIKNSLYFLHSITVSSIMLVRSTGTSHLLQWRIIFFWVTITVFRLNLNFNFRRRLRWWIVILAIVFIVISLSIPGSSSYDRRWAIHNRVVGSSWQRWTSQSGDCGATRRSRWNI